MKNYNFVISAIYSPLADVPVTGGVYLLSAIRTGAAIYAGKATNVKRRFQTHLHNRDSINAEFREWLKTVDKSLITAGVISLTDCERATELTGDSALLCVESVVIQSLMPHFNHQKTSRHESSAANTLVVCDKSPLSLSIGVVIGMPSSALHLAV